MPAKYTFLTALIVCLTNSCNTINSDERFTSFPLDIEISNYFAANPDLEFCFDPRNITFNDSLLVLRDARDINSFIKAYNKNTLEPTFTFGIVGQGPNEYLNPVLPYLDSHSGILWFNDGAKSNIHGVRITDLVTKGYEAEPIVSYNYHGEFEPFYEYTIGKDTSLYISTSRETALITKISLTSGSITSFGKSPHARKEIQNIYSHNKFYSRRMAFCEEKQKAVFAYNFFDKLLAYDLVSNETKQITGREYVEHKPHVLADGNVVNNHRGYMIIKHTKNYVFAAFLGMNHINYPEISANYPQELQVFDWDLNPKARLKFPNSIQDFAVEECGTFYVLAADLEVPLQIFKFDIDLLK